MTSEHGIATPCMGSEDEIGVNELLDKPLVYPHEFIFDKFRFHTTKYHILQSNCAKYPESCQKDSEDGLCQVCKYKAELSDLPQWPEMIFPENTLQIQLIDSENTATPCFIEFNALDALKVVDSKHPDVKVASSHEWQESRKESTLKPVLKPFDWTFTTEYKGTVKGFQISKTHDRIDLEKLKIHEEILHFQELPLFEDELGDNGCSMLFAKFRCMPSGFFVLLRFYLRVDGVMARINDTRFHWEKGNRFIKREFSSRENWVKYMSEKEIETILDPNALWSYLPEVNEKCEKFSF